MPPLHVAAEFVFSEDGEAAFLPHLERTLAETRAIDGCLQATFWTRPERRYLFSTLWTDADAVARWVDNEFHRGTLMPGFRKWCTEGWFGEATHQADHPRARRCAACGRWTQGRPGWDEARPAQCDKCGAGMPAPSA